MVDQRAFARLTQRAIGAGLAKNREVLLIGIPNEIVDNIPRQRSDAGQLQADAYHLSQLPENVLVDGVHPFAIWTQNVLDRLPGSMTYKSWWRRARIERVMFVGCLPLVVVVSFAAWVWIKGVPPDSTPDRSGVRDSRDRSRARHPKAPPDYRPPARRSSEPPSYRQYPRALRSAIVRAPQGSQGPAVEIPKPESRRSGGCLTNRDCSGGWCLGAGDGLKFCADPCEPGVAGVCGDGRCLLLSNPEGQKLLDSFVCFPGWVLDRMPDAVRSRLRRR